MRLLCSLTRQMTASFFLCSFQMSHLVRCRVWVCVCAVDTVIFTDVYEFNLLSFNLNVGHFYRFLLPVVSFSLSLLLWSPSTAGLEARRHQTKGKWELSWPYGRLCMFGNMLFYIYGTAIKVATPWWFNKMLKQHVQRQQNPWPNDIKSDSVRFLFLRHSNVYSPLADGESLLLLLFIFTHEFPLSNF